MADPTLTDAERLTIVNAIHDGDDSVDVRYCRHLAECLAPSIERILADRLAAERARTVELLDDAPALPDLDRWRGTPYLRACPSCGSGPGQACLSLADLAHGRAVAYEPPHDSRNDLLVSTVPARSETDDGMANDCTHGSASGVDTTPWDAILRELPMSGDGTGHIADCGYTHEVPKCGCYSLRGRLAQVVREHTAAKQAEAWAACVAEAEGLGWMHDLAADDVAGRNPYRAEGLHPEPAPDAYAAALALVSAVETIKQTGGSVEIAGVRIEPCDTYGATDTTRRADCLAAALARVLAQADEVVAEWETKGPTSLAVARAVEAIYAFRAALVDPDQAGGEGRG